MSSERTVRRLGTDLWMALNDGGIDVCFQPKVEMSRIGG
jgi:hypothetical protein